MSALVRSKILTAKKKKGPGAVSSIGVQQGLDSSARPGAAGSSAGYQISIVPNALSPRGDHAGISALHSGPREEGEPTVATTSEFWQSQLRSSSSAAAPSSASPRKSTTSGADHLQHHSPPHSHGLAAATTTPPPAAGTSGTTSTSSGGGPKLSAAQFLRLSKAASGGTPPGVNTLAPRSDASSGAAVGDDADAAVHSHSPTFVVQPPLRPPPPPAAVTVASPEPLVQQQQQSPDGPLDIISKLRARYGYGSFLDSLTSKALGNAKADGDAAAAMTPARAQLPAASTSHIAGDAGALKSLYPGSGGMHGVGAAAELGTIAPTTPLVGSGSGADGGTLPLAMMMMMTPMPQSAPSWLVFGNSNADSDGDAHAASTDVADVGSAAVTSTTNVAGTVAVRRSAVDGGVGGVKTDGEAHDACSSSVDASPSLPRAATTTAASATAVIASRVSALASLSLTFDSSTAGSVGTASAPPSADASMVMHVEEEEAHAGDAGDAGMRFESAVGHQIIGADAVSSGQPPEVAPPSSNLLAREGAHATRVATAPALAASQPAPAPAQPPAAPSAPSASSVSAAAVAGGASVPPPGAGGRRRPPPAPPAAVPPAAPPMSGQQPLQLPVPEVPASAAASQLDKPATVEAVVPQEAVSAPAPVPVVAVQPMQTLRPTAAAAAATPSPPSQQAVSAPPSPPTVVHAAAATPQAVSLVSSVPPPATQRSPDKRGATVASTAAPPAAQPSLSTISPATQALATRFQTVIKSYAGICEQGYSPSQPDKPCQDAIVMSEHPESDSVMLAVFDGHGEDGHLVATAFKERLPDLVFNHPKFNTFLSIADNIAQPSGDVNDAEGTADKADKQNFKSGALPACGPPISGRRDVAGAIKACLQMIEKQVLADPNVDCSLSGSTGCVVVVSGDHVTIANVGDSRAVLVRAVQVPPVDADQPVQASSASSIRLLPAPLTIDHKPTMSSETRRILLAGGRVHAIKYDDGVEGPVRVWCKDDDVPGLAMSRSLCDAIGKKAGITSTPDIYTYSLAESDAFLVVASDGLWEFCSARDISDILSATHSEAMIQALSYTAAIEDLQAAFADGRLTDEEFKQQLSEIPEPMQHLQVALDALAETAASRWQAREGVIDDTSIILAEIGRIAVAATA